HFFENHSEPIMHCQSAPQGDFTVLEATNAGRSTLKVTGQLLIEMTVLTSLSDGLFPLSQI
ncbi:MAG: hypothetical protein ACYSTW_06145, partial [Planctomycetota bacterium]